MEQLINYLDLLLYSITSFIPYKISVGSI